MARPSPLSRPGPRLQSGLGPPLGSGVITYGGHEGTDVEAALDGRPPTHVLASTDPTVTDDDGDGHVVGCRWINEASGEEFVAVDVSTGAAVWESTTAGGGGSTVDIEDEGSAEGAADTIDFVGAGVSVTFAGGTATVDIPGGSGSGDYVFIDEVTVGAGGTTALDMTGIPTTYRDLIVVVKNRMESTSNGEGARLRVGTGGTIDTGSNYQCFYTFWGWTGGPQSSTITDGIIVVAGADSDTTAGRWGRSQFSILDYASTAANKTVIGQAYTHDSNGHLFQNVNGVWQNASDAIDCLRLYPSVGDLAEGTTMTVYGRG